VDGAPTREEWLDELAGRRDAARELTGRSGADALVVFGFDGHAEPFRWLTGFQPLMGSMWLVLPAAGEASCAVEFPWQIAEARRRSGIERWHGAPGPVSAVVDWIHESGSLRLALAGSEWLPSAARQALEGTGAELVEAGAELARLRRCKSTLEVWCLRLAAGLTDEALETVRSELRPGLSEREIAARLGYILRRATAEWAFTPVVVSGVADPMPVREPLDRRLDERDTVMVDVGGSWDGYQADVSRTWIMGEPSELQAQVWDVVERAHAAAIEAARPGVPCAEVAEAATGLVHGAGYELGHRIGHGIGLATSFEWPSLDHEQAPLEPGMTFCIEPGVYLAGAGNLKLEDDVVVTATGCELLSNASRELRVEV
jgi:Xaa-Pro aminopeptidase